MGASYLFEPSPPNRGILGAGMGLEGVLIADLSQDGSGSFLGCSWLEQLRDFLIDAIESRIPIAGPLAMLGDLPVHVGYNRLFICNEVAVAEFEGELCCKYHLGWVW
jgi:hypothetical protein